MTHSQKHVGSKVQLDKSETHEGSVGTASLCWRLDLFLVFWDTTAKLWLPVLTMADLASLANINWPILSFSSR